MLKATDDVKFSFRSCWKNGNVNSIVIDLRSNGGRGADGNRFAFRSVYPFWSTIVQVRDNNGKVREDSDTDGVVYYKARWWCWSIVSVPRHRKSSLPRAAGLWSRADCR